MQPSLSLVARIFAGLIAAVCWAGLAVQFEASVGLTGSASGALVAMSRYFTVITNLALAVVFTGVAFGWRGFAHPALLGGATLAILLVGIVYGLLLRGLVELSGGALLADFLLHKATPVLAPIYWIAFAPKGGLRGAHPLVWTAFPLLYFAYALARGAHDGNYAYPFMDVAKLGLPRTSINALAIAAGFLVAGYLLVWLDRALARGRRAD